ncbi:MAG: DNA cytosine methyltransferase [Verrucomicrobiota bacterium]
MYRDHFGSSAGELIVGDIHKLDPSELPAVDLATAPFPCNDLSLAGALKGLVRGSIVGFLGVRRRVERVEKEQRAASPCSACV